jgi:hypothetical protein
MQCVHQFGGGERHRHRRDCRQQFQCSGDSACESAELCD